ncbi:hypothetical protein DAVIS_01857 [Mycobacterium marinum]|uniref:Uncharacterized protein n=1 Tax=Mycobacterium marinum TaxID=1781 RepID=A0A3E2MYE2_MYCMR|nr:hypothetical protein DAVIS_01857 [Mycobacterium marinum]
MATARRRQQRDRQHLCDETPSHQFHLSVVAIVQAIAGVDLASHLCAPRLILGLFPLLMRRKTVQNLLPRACTESRRPRQRLRSRQSVGSGTETTRVSSEAIKSIVAHGSWDLASLPEVTTVRPKIRVRNDPLVVKIVVPRPSCVFLRSNSAATTVLAICSQIFPAGLIAPSLLSSALLVTGCPATSDPFVSARGYPRRSRDGFRFRSRGRLLRVIRILVTHHGARLYAL